MSKVALLTSRDFVMYHIFNVKNPNAFYPEMGRVHQYPDLFLAGYSVEQINELPIGLGKRDFCETDPRFLQLIPYITVTAEIDGKLHYARYQRGSGSTEKRLTNYSIGFGGHIEENLFNNHNSIRTGAARELREELQLSLMVTDIRPDYLMFDPKPGVNQVHLAVVMNHRLSEEEIEKLRSGEEDIITKLEWKTKEELLSEHTLAVTEEGQGAKLEDWSLNILTYLENPTYADTLSLGEVVYVPRTPAI